MRDLISISKEVAKDREKSGQRSGVYEQERTGTAGCEPGKQMRAAAADLNFEVAAELRDKMVELKKNLEDIE